ncbi:hypothetical protein CDAR_278841 [Caerostris darwini]|uniref:Uncharacterized protein n=1 Tax=Caerostris darwini TaxID=1538125 RepID=A0AAV4WS01_9ARAC|nr:hypothetical protein CDAR_278841 [Caerostris darwini]
MPSNSSGMNRCSFAGVVPEKSKQGSGASSSLDLELRFHIIEVKIYLLNLDRFIHLRTSPNLCCKCSQTLFERLFYSWNTSTQLIRSLDSGCTHDSKLPPRTGRIPMRFGQVFSRPVTNASEGAFLNPGGGAAPTAHPVLTLRRGRLLRLFSLEKTVCIEGKLLSTFAPVEGISIRNLSCCGKVFKLETGLFL